MSNYEFSVITPFHNVVYHLKKSGAQSCTFAGGH